MPVTPVTVRLCDGVACTWHRLCPCRGHDANYGPTPCGDRTRRMAHTIGRANGFQGTDLQGRVLHLPHAEPVPGIDDLSRFTRDAGVLCALGPALPGVCCVCA